MKLLACVVAALVIELASCAPHDEPIAIDDAARQALIAEATTLCGKFAGDTTAGPVWIGAFFGDDQLVVVASAFDDAVRVKAISVHVDFDPAYDSAPLNALNFDGYSRLGSAKSAVLRRAVYDEQMIYPPFHGKITPNVTVTCDAPVGKVSTDRWTLNWPP